jgi:hypothetical protein
VVPFTAVAQDLLAGAGAIALIAVATFAMLFWQTRYSFRGADAVLVALGFLMGAMIVAVIVQGRSVPAGGYVLAVVYLLAGWGMHRRRRIQGDS